jgi:hypothetical protein
MRRLAIPLLAALVIGGLVVVGYWAGGRLGADAGGSKLLSLWLSDPDCGVYPDGCAASGEGLELRLRFLDPPSAMKPATLQLDSSLPLSLATVDFEMVGMDMGLNRYRLESPEGRRFQARVMLPVCVSGRRDWVARVYVVGEQGDYLAEFPFETRH